MITSITKFEIAFALVFALSAAGYGRDVVKTPELSGGGPAQQLVGYWAPDVEASLKIAKGAEEDTEAHKKSLQSMIIEFKEGKLNAYARGSAQESAYRITRIDDKTDSVTFMVKGEDGEEVEATATMDKDQIILTRAGETIILKRTDWVEFDKRREAAKKTTVVPQTPTEK